MEKTNAVRLLERQKTAYRLYHYDGGALSGAEVAKALGLPPETVLKTLVTVGKSGGHYVFMLPVEAELDLKKAAAAVGEKAISMLPQKELLPLTGYVHGGCSPIGMKKQFPTVVDSSAAAHPLIRFSAGKIGVQVELPPEALRTLVPYIFAEVCI